MQNWEKRQKQKAAMKRNASIESWMMMEGDSTIDNKNVS